MLDDANGTLWECGVLVLETLLTLLGVCWKPISDLLMLYFLQKKNSTTLAVFWKLIFVQGSNILVYH